MPVLFLTARVLEEDQLRGYELGADDYILKSIFFAGASGEMPGSIGAISAGAKV